MAQQDNKRQDDSARTRQAAEGGGQPQSAGLQRTGQARSGGITPWRAESPLTRMMSEMDFLFDQMQRRFFGPLMEGMGPWRGGERGGMMGRSPRLELDDTGEELLLHAEIPGVDAKDLQIEYRDGVVTVRAENREEEGDDAGGRFRRFANFFGQIALPVEVDVDRANAAVKNGVLTVRFPKRADSENVRRIPISGSEGRREAA